jgi:D-xylose transport system permease protein
MTTTTTAHKHAVSEAPPSLRSRLREGLGQEFRLAAVGVVLLAIWLFFFWREPLFLSSNNLTNLALQTVVTGILALGVTFVLFLGEIDLSIGAASGVMAAIAGRLVVDAGISVGVAIAVAVVAGAAFGALQGLIIVMGAPSFMVTLGASIALGGFLLIALPSTGSIDLSQTAIRDLTLTFLQPASSWLLLVLLVAVIWLLKASERGRLTATSLLERRLLLSVGLMAVAGALMVGYFNSSRGVPLALTIMLALYLLAWYLTTQTRFGVSVFAVGGSRAASRRAGLHVERTTIICFMICGALAAFGGIIAASRVLGVSNQSGGGDLLLQAIAAAVIGGTSLFGGRGSVWAALLGAFTIGSVSNGMDLLGLTTEVKLIVTGLILVLAVSLDALVARGGLRPGAVS